jgi:hypothetical protein
MLSLICALTAAYALMSAPAVALNTHVPSSSFGSVGSGAGQLSSPDGLALNTTTHDLYVADRENARIDEFSTSGSFIRAWGWGVADGMPKFETCTLVCQQGVSGSGPGQFTTPSFVAVDNSSGGSTGDVYVGDPGDGLVSKFTAAGAPVESWGAKGQQSGAAASKGPFAPYPVVNIAGIAVDPSGTLLVINEASVLFKYAQDGTFQENFAVERYTSGNGLAVDAHGAFFKVNGSVEELTGEGESGDVGQLTQESAAKGVAIDPATEDLYVSEGDKVGHYASAGPGLVKEPGGGGCTVEKYKGCPASDSFGAQTLGAGTGIAVQPAGTEVYVADASVGKIYTFVPAVLPDASTGEATKVINKSATISGTVDPDGTATTYQFEYGTSASYGSAIPLTPGAVGSDESTHQLTANLTGLTPSSTYHYRIAASNANGTNYGSDRTFNTVGPPTITYSGIQRRESTTAELITSVNPHGVDTHVHFEYGTSAAYASSTPSVDLGTEEANTLPEIVGLTPSTTYHFRVVAENAEGTVYGADQVFSTEPAVSIKQVTVISVGTASATLSARVSDYELVGTAHFEYGTTASYGTATAPVSLPAVEYPETVTISLDDLQPETTYHFRVVAETAAGKEAGPDTTFTTESLAATSLALPDGRGYEKVSPNANADGDVFQDVPAALGTEAGHTEQPFLVSPDGSAVAYMGSPSEHGGTGQEGAGLGNQYVARRTASGGWSATDVDPASSDKGDVPVYQGFSSDLSTGFLVSNGLVPLAAGAPGEAFSVLYAHGFSSNSYEALIKTKPPHRSPEEFEAPDNPAPGGVRQVAYAGSSSDLTHNLFMANDALTANAEDGGPQENNLYDTSAGTTALVNILPDGSTEANAMFGGPALASDSRSNQPILPHDISEDGSRIFWTNLNDHDLYVREHDTAPQSPVVEGSCTDSTDACTTLIAKEAQFWNATSDGSKVLYSSEGDLYEHDLTSGQTIDLAPHGELKGVVAASEDLSYVYFVANAALAPGAKPQECVEAQASETFCNLYVAHIGEPTRFIGLLGGGDNYAYPESATGGSDGPWQGGLGNSEAEATPDGAHLLFTSKSSLLTGYENKGSGQVFLYDYDSSSLSCVSCNPSGETVHNEGESYSNSAFLPVSHLATAAPHWMSDDGDEVFFDDVDPLVPQDTNGQTDVYEWERDGSGSCTQSRGCIYLLSDGTAPEGSFLIGSSTNGDDVFITTRSQLVPEDENENIDVYDVRADAVKPPEVPQCTGSGCQGLPSTPPIFATPPSVTYNGVGNFNPPTSAKVTRAKPLTRAQKLARALKACKGKAKKKRASCEAKARKKYRVTKQRRSVKRSEGKGR